MPRENGYRTMNLKPSNTALVLCLLCSLPIIQPGIAQSTDPKTVRDYFLAAPKEYVGLSREEREVLLKGPGVVLDIKNGYLSYNASDNPEEFEFALFKQTDGSYIVAF